MDKHNIQAAIRQFGSRDLMVEQLDELEEEGRRLEFDKFKLETLERQRIKLPESPKVLNEMMQREMNGLAVDSFEFADLMRTLISSFHVYLVQLVDGGNLYSRAKVVLDLAGKYPDFNLSPELHAMVRKEFTLDLWDDTPQRD